MDYRKKICDAIDILASNVSQNFTDNERDLKISAWHIGLKDISDVQVDIGLEKALGSNERFFPTCGQFKDYCDNVDNVEQLAVSSFNLLMSEKSITKSPYFEDVFIAQTVRDLGGWQAISMWETSERQWKEKEFVASYIINRKRGDSDINPFIENGNMPIAFIGEFKSEEKEQIKIQLKDEKEKPLIEYAQSQLEMKSTIGQKDFTPEELQEEAKLSKSNIRLQRAQRETSNGLKRLLDIAKGEPTKREPYKFNSGNYIED